jgi:hypothetical protein
VFVIVTERCRAGARNNSLRESVLKIPRVRRRPARVGFARCTAVYVIRDRRRRSGCQLTRRVRHTETHFRELLKRIVSVVFRDVVQVIGLAGAVAGIVICIASAIQRGGSGLVQHAGQARQ